MDNTGNSLPGDVPTPTERSHPSSFSPTALRAYDTCPRSYEFAYLERPEVDEPASAHLIFGNALHQALAFLFRLASDERTLEVAQRALRHFWARQEDRDEAFLTVEEEARWGEDALLALDVFCTERAGELQIEPVAIEKWVSTPLPDGYGVGGKVDRADEISAMVAGEEIAGLRITDYKTGRCRLEEGEELAEDRGAQVYALAASRAFSQPVLEVRFLYLRENRALSWYPEREDLIGLEEVLGRSIGQIIADESFEARPDFHCRWCRYRSICPQGSGRVEAEQLDAEPATVF